MLITSPDEIVRIAAVIALDPISFSDAEITDLIACLHASPIHVPPSGGWAHRQLIPRPEY